MKTPLLLSLFLLFLLCSCALSPRISKLQHLQSTRLSHQLHTNLQQATLHHSYTRHYTQQDSLVLLSSETWTQSQQVQAQQQQQTDTLTQTLHHQVQTQQRSPFSLTTLAWVLGLTLGLFLLLLRWLPPR